MMIYCLVCFYYVFFFFKQKTAYEMRISDWSSDVCSSDLVGDALGGGEEVRLDAEIVGGEGRAEAAEAGDHLVEDQQDAVLVADRAQPLQVSLRRDQHPGGTGHGLADHRGDGRRVVQGDQTLQLVGQLAAMLRHPAET